MSERIIYDKQGVCTFKEKFVLNKRSPYSVNIKSPTMGRSTPLHYSDELEILINCDTSGFAVIDGHYVPFSDKSVMVIPPDAIHTVTWYSGGWQYIIHISINDLKPFVDVSELLQFKGCSLSSLCYICPKYDDVLSLTKELISHDDDSILLRMSIMLSLLDVVTNYKYNPEDDSVWELNDVRHSLLTDIMEWTTNHYANNITLEAAAEHAGFTRNYFCNWFKSLTRMTYFDYLRDVKLTNSRKVLLETGSLTKACFECGFQTMSYFIKSFKAKYDYTPKKYLELFSKGQLDNK